MRETVKLIGIDPKELEVTEFYHKDNYGREYKTKLYSEAVSHKELAVEFVAFLRKTGYTWEGKWPKWINEDEL